jgi:3-oxoacyl-[acyl-carrier-protein] synthase-3
VIALRTAAALVQAGEHERVLVVVSATYSRAMDESDVLSWFLGDGAGAFLVAREQPGHGILGSLSVHTAETCGSLFWQAVNDPSGNPRMQIKAAPGSGKMLRDSSVPALRSCCLGAADAAGVALSDIDFFVFNTPVAWFHTFAARALEIDPEKTLTTFPLYGNMGPALTTANLYHAAAEGRIREGSLVLVFGIGSVSSAAATVMRWGRVGLGPAPA